MCCTFCVSLQLTVCWCAQVGYKCMRPRTNKRSAFATKCMVLAAYLTVNMGIGCTIAVTTAWFWWVFMMMGILLFLLGHAHRHLCAVSGLAGPMLAPSQTAKEAESCQSCSTCNHSCAQSQQQCKPTASGWELTAGSAWKPAQALAVQ